MGQLIGLGAVIAVILYAKSREGLGVNNPVPPQLRGVPVANQNATYNPPASTSSSILSSIASAVKAFQSAAAASGNKPSNVSLGSGGGGLSPGGGPSSPTLIRPVPPQSALWGGTIRAELPIVGRDIPNLVSLPSFVDESRFFDPNGNTLPFNAPLSAGSESMPVDIPFPDIPFLWDGGLATSESLGLGDTPQPEYPGDYPQSAFSPLGDTVINDIPEFSWSDYNFDSFGDYAAFDMGAVDLYGDYDDLNYSDWGSL